MFKELIEAYKFRNLVGAQNKAFLHISKFVEQCLLINRGESSYEIHFAGVIKAIFDKNHQKIFVHLHDNEYSSYSIVFTENDVYACIMMLTNAINECLIQDHTRIEQLIKSKVGYRVYLER